MNHLAKVLEVLVGGVNQVNIHLDVNGEIRISKIKPKGKLWNQIKNNTAMLNQEVTYNFSYELYKDTLKKSIIKSFPEYKEIVVREKQLDPKRERLYGKFLNSKYA